MRKPIEGQVEKVSLKQRVTDFHRDRAVGSFTEGFNTGFAAAIKMLQADLKHHGFLAKTFNRRTEERVCRETAQRIATFRPTGPNKNEGEKE